jgi:PTS system nitrogen regulatory IIA component
MARSYCRCTPWRGFLHSANFTSRRSRRLHPEVQLTIQQAAALLNVPEAQVHRWIRDRGLPAVLFNEQYRLNRVGLMDWAQRNQIRLPVPEHDEDRAPIRLAEALARGGVHRDLPGRARKEIVAAAVDRLRLPPAVDRDLLREMILARTSHDATAIGSGVALPHARYPFVAAVGEPILGLFFLREPVDFGAADGIPVTALFVLVSPTTRAHLQLLARVAGALGDGLRLLVEERATDERILAAAAACDLDPRGRRP